mgnify:CR=1 FL=1
MYKKNDGLTEDHRLQNQFTAFWDTTLCNGRKVYLRGIYRQRRREFATDDLATLYVSNDGYIEPLADYRDLYTALHFFKKGNAEFFWHVYLMKRALMKLRRILVLAIKGLRSYITAPSQNCGYCWEVRKNEFQGYPDAC